LAAGEINNTLGYPKLTGRIAGLRGKVVRVIASERRIGEVSARLDKRRAARVIAFPAFESYGDAILEWLAALGEGEPGREAVLRLAGSMQRAVVRIERVRTSIRHRNLATFIRHAQLALQISEWNGARYVLLTAFATLSASAFTEQKPCGPAGIVLQFPAPEAVTGTVNG
jgi:hypothetical protein